MTPDNADTKLWSALEQLDDDLLDPNLPEAVVDGEARALGIDVDALAKRGIAFVTTLREELRLSWQDAAKIRQLEMERRAEEVEIDPQLDRQGLLARIDQLRVASPGIRTAITMAARKRKPEESSDEELRTLLQEMETLRALEQDDTE